MKIVKEELEEMEYLIKQIISNISLDKYYESLYNLLSLLDELYSIKDKISKENY